MTRLLPLLLLAVAGAAAVFTVACVWSAASLYADLEDGGTE